MILGAPCKLLDVLAAWGRHEALGRGGLAADSVDVVEYLLQTRSPMIGPILSALPRAVHEVTLQVADVPLIRLYNGDTIEQWKAKAERTPESLTWYRSRADGPEQVTGPLVCTVHAQGSELVPPWVLHDGLHRAAAWSEHIDRGTTYDVSGFLIVTEHPMLRLA